MGGDTVPQGHPVLDWHLRQRGECCPRLRRCPCRAWADAGQFPRGTPMPRVMTNEDRAALEVNLAALDDNDLLERAITEYGEHLRYRRDDLVYEVCMAVGAECKRRG